MRNLLRSFTHAVSVPVKFLLENPLEFFPLRRALTRYNSRKLRADVFAGINVALLAIPQSMAFALIAGLDNVAYGITCNAVACLVGPWFASSRLTSLGPTNATSLMIFSALAGTGIAATERLHLLPVLIFLAGLLLVVGAYLRTADLIQYISRSVVVGYITGAGCLIIAGQLRETLGIAPPPTHSGAASRGLFSLLGDWAPHLDRVHWPTLVVSVVTVAIYVLLRRTLRGWPCFAMTLVGVSVAVALLQWWGVPLELRMVRGFSLEQIVPSLPKFREAATFDNISLLMGPAIAVAFLAALENSVMSKTLASRTGERPDPNQDMLAVGVANLSAAFVGQMPVSGSLTRSTFNQESGAVTQNSSLVTGVLCLLGVLFLGGAVHFIPLCCLSVLIIAISLTLFNRRHLTICFRATRSDAITLVTTVVATLIMPLHVAIFIGVAISVVLYLRKAARPSLVEYSFNQEGSLMEKHADAPRDFPQISIVHVEGELFFGAAELFRTQIQRTVADPNLRVIILRMKNARHLDATSVMALEELIRFLRSKNRHLIISGAMKGLYRVLKDSGMVEVIGRDNLFLGSAQNPNISTRNALLRAQQLLGRKDAEVKIYFDPSHATE